MQILVILSLKIKSTFYDRLQIRFINDLLSKLEYINRIQIQFSMKLQSLITNITCPQCLYQGDNHLSCHVYKSFILRRNSASADSISKANTIEHEQACMSNFVQKLIYSRIFSRLCLFCQETTFLTSRRILERKGNEREKCFLDNCKN